MRKTKEQKGITLVALVITIILLLILAGISIQAITNQGLFGRANEAKRESEIANIKEQIALDIYEKQLEPPVGSITEEQLEEILGKYGTVNKGEDGKIIGITTDEGYEILLSEIYSGGTTEEAETPVEPEPPADPSLPTNPATTIAEAQSDYMLTKTVNSPIQDEFGNRITVPAGFKIKVDSTTNNATTVDKGIVIIDSSQNEFVWIPTGKIYTDTAKTEANAKTINLNRYTFDDNGNPTTQNDMAIALYDYNCQELSTSTLKNTTAKNINDFKTKASSTGSGGFYIGRYEARKNTSGTITEKGTDSVWNSITQPNAATQARNMYQNATTFTSDLINSYAWDTATLFLQTCGDNSSTYSRKTSVNTSLATTGTNNQTTKDVQCNVYDMASNVREWTTETSSNSDNPCVYRGGVYFSSKDYTSNRAYTTTSASVNNISFRPILYV